MYTKTNAKSMHFRTLKNLVNLLENLTFWVVEIAIQNICKFVAKLGVQLTFFMKSVQMYAKTNAKSMPFPNFETPSKPIGKLDILSSRNHTPKHM